MDILNRSKQSYVLHILNITMSNNDNIKINAGNI